MVANTIPPKYLCPLSKLIMVDPVVAADGLTYEREKIEEWFLTNNTSPVKKTPLENKTVYGTEAQQSDILIYLENHPEHYDNGDVYLPRAWIKAFTDAINNKNIAEVQKWLDRDRRLLTLKTDFEMTPGVPLSVLPLQLACKTSSPEIVDLLINQLVQKSLLDINSEIPDLDTTFLNKLLENYLTSKDYTKCELLETLGADIEQPDGQLNTLLLRMINTNNLASVTWLLEHGANLESRNSTQNTPLMLAVTRQLSPIVQLLLSKNAAKEARNFAGATPLHTAVTGRNIALVNLLLSHSADPCAVTTNTKETILHAAIVNLPILKLVLTIKGAADLIDAKDTNGNTALHRAVAGGYEDVVAFLLEQKANRNVKNTAKQTPQEMAQALNKSNIDACIDKTVKKIKQAKENRVTQLETKIATLSVDSATKDKEIERLHTTIAAQTSEIEQLKQKLTTVEAAETKHEKNLSAMWKRVGQENPKVAKGLLAGKSVFAQSKEAIDPAPEKPKEEIDPAQEKPKDLEPKSYFSFSMT